MINWHPQHRVYITGPGGALPPPPWKLAFPYNVGVAPSLKFAAMCLPPLSEQNSETNPVTGAMNATHPSILIGHIYCMYMYMWAMIIMTFSPEIQLR